jgi:protein-disulfide isomerase
VGAVASLAGVLFSAVSTHDYAQHLDRRLHGTHCSFLPGIGDATTGENACTVAMYSPYSALMKEKLWGGLPISLFALGTFAFLFAASLYFALAGREASRQARLGYFLATLAPLGASLVMFIISITKLGEICKLCAGIYVSSIALAIAGFLVLWAPASEDSRPGPPDAPKPPKNIDPDRTELDPEPWHKKDGKRAKPAVVPEGSWLAPVGLLAALAVSTAAPAMVYAASLPDYSSRILSCGTLANTAPKKGVLVKVPTTTPLQPAISFEDPLCPACKALHDRLVDAEVYEKLDLQVAIFPLDSECNWMLSRPMHPGACVIARAFLCAEEGGKAREVLEWSYANQPELTEAGKKDVANVRAKVKQRFPELDGCIDSKETKKRLDEVLQFAVANKIRVSTPQLYLGDQRVCDEDTDMGMPYTLRKLAPELAKGGK